MSDTTESTEHAATGDTGAAEQATTDTGNDTAADSIEARLAALEGENAALRASAAEADAAAESVRVAALSDAEKLAEDRAAFSAEVEATQAAFMSQRRTSAFDRLGVLPNYRDYVPAADPQTTEGAALIEKWAKDHPEAVRQQTTAAPYTPTAGSKLAQLLTGALKSPYATADSARKALSN